MKRELPLSGQSTGSKTARSKLKDSVDSYATEALVPAAHWQGTLACGVLKVLIAAVAITLPLLKDRQIALSIGWMLIAGGAAEFLLGWSAHRSAMGKVTLGSGILTLLAGVLFVTSGWTGLFPVASIVIVWLLLRGLIWLDIGFLSSQTFPHDSVWLLLRGLVDLGLGLLLMMGVSIASMIIFAIGVTSYVLTAVGASLSISFLVGGVSLIAIALSQRSPDHTKLRGT